MSTIETGTPGAWLTVTQAAAIAGVSEKTLRKRINNGTVAARRETLPTGGWTWRVEAAQLEPVGTFQPRDGSIKEGLEGSLEPETTVTVEDVPTVPTCTREAVGSVTEGAATQAEVQIARIEGYLAANMSQAVESAVRAATAPLVEQNAQLLDELRAMRERMESLEKQAASTVEISRENAPQTPETGVTGKDKAGYENPAHAPTSAQPRGLWRRVFGVFTE